MENDYCKDKNCKSELPYHDGKFCMNWSFKESMDRYHAGNKLVNEIKELTNKYFEKIHDKNTDIEN